MMIESRRRAYLEAMGIDVWLARPPAPEWDRLLIGPGQGSTLMVCREPGESAGKLARDVARAIGQDPVWAWPDPESAASSPKLRDAVENRLFTRVIVFGDDLAGQLFKGEPPGVLVSAAVVTAPGLEELAVRGTAKQTFWSQLLDSAQARAG